MSSLTAPPAPTTQDALQLLHGDHRAIAAAFADLRRIAAGGGGAQHDSDRQALVARLGVLLRGHAAIEEEVFYPAVRRAGGEGEAIERAHGEHAQALSQLEALAADEGPHDAWDAAVAALEAAVAEHVRFEEGTLFERARASGIDLVALGTRLAMRRGQWLGDQGVD